MYILKYFYLTWCIFFNQPEVTFRTTLVLITANDDTCEPLKYNIWNWKLIQ